MRKLFFLTVFGLLGSISAFCASEALIVTGVSGGEVESEEWAVLVKKVKEALSKRGVPVGSIRTIGGATGKVARREEVLKSIKSVSGRVGVEDEFWLVLFGHSSRGRKGVPTFQVRGPRVTAEDLREALAPFKGKQFVFIGTSRSGAYLPFLQKEGCDVLAATRGEGEVGRPRFPEFWADAFLQHPDASLNVMAAEAAEGVKTYLASMNLGQGEHARLYDSARDEVLSAPFGVENLATKDVRDVAKRPRPVSPDEIVIPEEFKQDLFVYFDATEESLAVVATAIEVENPDGYNALVLKKDVVLTVTGDRSTREDIGLRVYLIDGSSFGRWANFHFPLNPPREVSRIEGARIILPDGSFYALNTEVLEKTGSFSGSLYFPQAEAGSVVELKYAISSKSSYSIPEFYLEYPLQESVPVLESSVTLKLPKKKLFYYYLKNLDAEAVKSESEHSTVYAWEFGALSAYEGLPNDPPRREMTAWLGVSSLASWEDFTQWYVRITEGAFEAGPKVKEKASEIAKNYGSRLERIRAAYEFVNALRYVAIEFGISGLRPRTPEETISNRYGDCKDKANLLIALLEELEVDANFVLINRMSSTDPDFPGWQFNHAIAYVPPVGGEEVGMWLDTTDTTTPFGFIAPGNIGRQGLVFDGSKSQFMEVTTSKNAMTVLTQRWALTQHDSEHWKGSLDVSWTGMMGYYARQRYRSLSPRQLEYLASQEVAGDYTVDHWKNLVVSNPLDFTQPFALSSEVVLYENRFPAFAEDWRGLFSSPERDRDMLLNDNQPFRLEQVVSLNFASVVLSEDFGEAYEKNMIGHHWSVHYVQKSPKEWVRTAVYEVDVPRVIPEFYPLVRRELNAWTRRLRKDIF